jgi:hypothetical protein
MLRKLTLSTEVDGNNPVEGDLHVASHKQVYSTTLAEQVAQRIMSRFRFFRGEWFRNLLQGTPWFQEVLEKGTSRSRIDSILRRVITSTPGVVSIDSYSNVLDNKTRTLSVNFVAVLADGTTLRSEDFGPFIVGG